MKKERVSEEKIRNGNLGTNDRELQPSNQLQVESVLALKVEVLEFYISEINAPGANKSLLREKIKKIKKEIKELKLKVKLTNESLSRINVLINTRKLSLRNIARIVLGRFSIEDISIEVSGYPIPDPENELVHYRLVITSNSNNVVLTTIMDDALELLIADREFESRDTHKVATTNQIKFFLYDELKDLAKLVAEHGDR